MHFHCFHIECDDSRYVHYLLSNSGRLARIFSNQIRVFSECFELSDSIDSINAYEQANVLNQSQMNSCRILYVFSREFEL